MKALKEKRSEKGEKTVCFSKLTIVGDKAGIPRTSCGKSIKWGNNDQNIIRYTWLNLQIILC